MLIVIFIIILLVIYLIYKKNQIETFYPAWNNYVIYNELSKRLRIGIWKEWINLNNLQFMEKLTHLTNCEIRLYDSNKELFNDLIFEKKIDIGFVTEADYGTYILSTLTNHLETENLTRKMIIENKDLLDKKYNTRRLYTLYPMYRVFLTNHFKISKDTDISNKTIRITNLSNAINKLDLELLKNYNYNQIYKADNDETNRILDMKSLQGKVDGFFTIFNNPDKNLEFFSEYANINLIDLYNNSNNNKFTKPNEILDKYFFLKKDKMDLIYYPKIIQRRKQTFDYYNLPYHPRYLNCYSYKTILITRKDVNDEAIYLFTKNFYKNIDKLKYNIPYFEFLNKKDIFSSVLDDILSTHRALYKPK